MVMMTLKLIMKIMIFKRQTNMKMLIVKRNMTIKQATTQSQITFILKTT